MGTEGRNNIQVTVTDVTKNAKINLRADNSTSLTL